MASAESNSDRPRVTRQVKLKIAILAILPALLALDSGVALARGAPYFRANLMVLTLAALVLLALLLIATAQRGRWFLQNHGESLAYVGYAALGAWLLAEEITLRFLLGLLAVMAGL